MAGKRWDALTMREGKNGNTYWTRIGALFESKDGGFNCELDALPINGKIVFRVPRERAPKDAQSGDGFGDDQIPF